LTNEKDTNSISGTIPIEFARLSSLRELVLCKYFLLALKSTQLDLVVSHRDQCLASLCIIYCSPPITDDNKNMTGDATTFFCDATSNYEFINASAFPNLSSIQLPHSVTCDCCSAFFDDDSHNVIDNSSTTSTTSSSRTQEEDK
jgi:hypothetical protein